MLFWGYRLAAIRMPRYLVKCSWLLDFISDYRHAKNQSISTNGITSYRQSWKVFFLSMVDIRRILEEIAISQDLKLSAKVCAESGKASFGRGR